MIIFKREEPYIIIRKQTALSNFQQFILTLIKLKLNLQFKDLSYRFNIHPSTVSSTFEFIIDVMYQ